MQSPLKIASRLLLSLIIAGAAACSGDDGGSTGPNPSPSEDVSGSYALTQVRTQGNLGGGGTGLPVTFIDGSGDHLTFVSGTLTMDADGGFDLKIRVTFNGSASELTDYGTYSAAGGSIDFNSQKATPRLSVGSVSGDKITAIGQVGGIPFEWDVVR